MTEKINLLDLINEHFSSMTAAQMKIANGILSEPTLCLFSSIEQAAKQFDVSTATLVRFAQMLGLHGYVQLQDMIREHYWQHHEPVVRLNSANKDQNSADVTFRSIYQRQMNLLESMYTPDMDEKLQQAVELLTGAEQIYTIGYRGSFACSYYIGHHLNRILGNCEILENQARLSDYLLKMKAGDVIFIVSQPRYNKQMYQACAMAREMGVKIITISDSLTAPYMKISDVFFAVPVKSGDFHNSLMASMMLAEIIITSTANYDRDGTQKRLQRMEHYFKQMDFFV